MNVVILCKDESIGARDILETLESNGIRVQAVVAEIRQEPPLTPVLILQKMRGRSILELGRSALGRALGRRRTGRRVSHRAPTTPRSLSTCSRARGVRYFRVPDHNGPEAVELLGRLQPDLLILGGTRIIRRQVLDIPRVGTLNSHMGLLPKYRGMNVTEWSVFNGDPVGVTVHFVDEGVDTGDILGTEVVAIDDCPSIERLRAKVNRRQFAFLVECVRRLADGNAPQPIRQEAAEGKQYYVMHARLRDMLERKLRRVARTADLAPAPSADPALATKATKSRRARAIFRWPGRGRFDDSEQLLPPLAMLSFGRTISEQLGEPIRMVDQSATRTGCQTIWVEGQRPYVVKLARSHVASRRLEENAKGLAALANATAADPALSRLIPKILHTGRFDGKTYSIETALPGTKATEHFASPQARERVALEAMHFLVRLQTFSREQTVLDLETWNSNFLPMIDAVGGFVRLHDPAGIYDRIARSIRDPLLDQSVPLVFAHGNYWMGNLLFDPDQGVTGVIDWDSAVPRGLPLVDLLYYLVRTETLIKRTRLGDAIAKWIAEDLQPLVTHPLVGEYCRAFSIPTAWLRPLFYYCWIQHVNIHVRFGTPVLEKPTWVRNSLHNVLAEVARAEGWNR